MHDSLSEETLPVQNRLARHDRLGGVIKSYERVAA